MIRAKRLASHTPAVKTGRVRRDLLIRQMGRAWLFLAPLLSYFILWAQILVLVIYSFNDSSSVSFWRGFTTKWYAHILQDTISAGTESARFQTTLLLQSVRN